MSKRRPESGGERRQSRRRAGQGPQLLRLPRRRLLWIGTGAATAAVSALALALVLLAGGGCGGAEPSVLGSPTAQASPTAQSSPTALASPTAADRLPPVAGEPRYTDSGLGIIDIEAGSGEPPKKGQTVVVRYIGYLSDGSKYLDTGRSVEFAVGLGKAIAGIDEGVSTMKVGGKRRLILPPDLAYGERGHPPTIPPNATLTFDVEMLEIK